MAAVAYRPRVARLRGSAVNGLAPQPPWREPTNDDRPSVRRQHRRRHGAAELHAPGPALEGGRGGCAPAGQQDGHGPGPGRAQQGDGPRLHLLRGLRPGEPPRRHQQGRGGRARLPAADSQGGHAAVKQALRRRLVVVGGCIGTDAHTVGIDAILNIKGFAGEKGLEYYREIKVVNLGAQVLVPELVARARAERADAVLVSQVVTQKDAHIHNTTQMSAAFREAFPATRRPLLVVGGPRFDEKMSGELGVDRVFGRGTTPGEVASYLVHRGITEKVPA